MPQTRPSTTPSMPSSGSRLITRLASPFAQKVRNLTDFHIQLENPHKQYQPGDEVQGSVNLRVLKPTRVTHVVVCLHGFVQVYKNPGSPPSDGYRANGVHHIGTGRGSRAGEYFGNGFASLFEDEVVLCGDGRLGDGQYKFQFEVVFPDRDLPSSISFERGTISYMITATITRPTTMSPVIQCDHKVYLVENIDIASVLAPKAQTITLEPRSRRARAKTGARHLVDKTSRKDGSGNTQDANDSERRGSQTSSAQSSAIAETPRSPGHSEVSFESGPLSSLSRASQYESTSQRQSDADEGNVTKASFASRTITATVETLTGGVLRGDSIPVRVHVNHTKHVKSLHGVIITLYRHARVDMHPAIPVGPTEKGKEARYEDYYPKSLTGLGGLSLSGAGSSHVFRKDVAQTVVPLIINPETLTAEVTGRVHVPEECFPTISTVPGAMITFKYYVEVVLDIQGKLQSSDRNLSNLGGLAATITTGNGISGVEGTGSAFGPMIDTATVRRDKGVVACTFEVVVGTKDSARQSAKGKRKADPEVGGDQGSQPQQVQPQQAQPGATPDPSNGYHGEYWQGQEGFGYEWSYEDSNTYAADVAYSGYDESAGYYAYWHPPSVTNNQPPPPIAMPPPPLEDESHLTEKERLRRAEVRLLPSQPPEEASSTSHEPTAPHLPDELQLVGVEHAFVASSSTSNPNLMIPPPFSVAAPAYSPSPNGTAILAAAQAVPLPQTPAQEPRKNDIPGSSVGHNDNQELSRRDFAQQASTSALGDRDEAEAAGPSVLLAPGADEIYDTTNSTTEHDRHGDAQSGAMELPRYER